MNSLFNFFKRNKPARTRDKLDVLHNEFPDPRLPFGILDSEWEHFIFNDYGHSRNLEENRLDDRFIGFLGDNIGGFEGKTVLELGPYEGYHTHSLCQHGAAKVIAVEGNPRNFLKCLIVKNHYQLNAAQFLLGDFLKYMRRTDERFDFILAAGVLYHSAFPIALLDRITSKSNAIGICTTTYHPDNLSFKMSGKTRKANLHGTEPFTLYQRKNPTWKTKNAKHGMDDSAWMISEEDLLRFLDFRGFDCEVFQKGCDNKYGAHRIRLFAKKREVGTQDVAN